jgi:hypothetical protein
MFDDINKKIIDILEIETLPENQQKDAMEKLGSLIYQEVLFKALNNLHQEDKDHFNKMLEVNPDPEILFVYLSGKIPTFSEIILEETKKLKEHRDEILSQ